MISSLQDRHGFESDLFAFEKRKDNRYKLETVTLTDRQKAELDALHDDMMEFVKQVAP